MTTMAPGHFAMLSTLRIKNLALAADFRVASPTTRFQANF